MVKINERQVSAKRPDYRKPISGPLHSNRLPLNGQLQTLEGFVNPINLAPVTALVVDILEADPLGLVVRQQPNAFASQGHRRCVFLGDRH